MYPQEVGLFFGARFGSISCSRFGRGTELLKGLSIRKALIQPCRSMFQDEKRLYCLKTRSVFLFPPARRRNWGVPSEKAFAPEVLRDTHRFADLLAGSVPSFGAAYFMRLRVRVLAVVDVSCLSTAAFPDRVNAFFVLFCFFPNAGGVG